MTDDVDAADGDDEPTYVSAQLTVDVEIRLPRSGPFSFDPLAQPIVEGETKAGVPITMKSTGVRDQRDILIEFGRLSKDGQLGVFVPAAEMVRAANELVQSTEGIEFPEPPEPESDGE